MKKDEMIWSCFEKELERMGDDYKVRKAFAGFI